MRIVLMDGDCSFCHASVQFIIKRDRGAFHFASLQSEFGQKLVKQYHLEHVDSVVLIETGKAYIYSDAALRIANQLVAPWRYIGVATIIPKPIRDAAYRVVAKNRHYLLRKQPVCAIPSEKDRARFLA